MPSNKTSPVFFYTYILLSNRDHEHYIGYTANLKQRLEEHRQGTNFSTKSRLPVQLIYYEACLNQDNAQQREKYLKSTAGRRFLAQRLRHFKARVVEHRA